MPARPDGCGRQPVSQAETARDGFLDQVDDALGVGEHHQVGGVDLDGGHAGPLVAVALHVRVDGAVGRGDQSPGGRGPPGGGRRGVGERLCREGALGDGEDLGETDVDVGGEDGRERVGPDRHVGAVLGRALDGEGRADECGGKVGVREAALEFTEALALLQGVTRQVDQCLHVVLGTGDRDDGGSAVGVAHQHDGTGDLTDDRGDVRGVADQAAVGHGRGDHVQTASDQPRDHLGVAGGVGERAVHEDDGRLGGTGHGSTPFGVSWSVHGTASPAEAAGGERDAAGT